MITAKYFYAIVFLQFLFLILSLFYPYFINKLSACYFEFPEIGFFRGTIFPEWKIEHVSGNDINTVYRRYREIRSIGATMTSRLYRRNAVNIA